MDADMHKPTGEDKEEGLTFRERLARLFEHIDERLKDPTLTLDQQYEIASRLIGLFE